MKYVPFKTPGELADQAGNDVWDIGLIGAEPQRAEKIAFTAAYVEIEATYMVPPGSPISAIADVDRKGVRIAVSARSAYDLWLENNIKNATLVRVSGLDAAFKKFIDDKLDALAGLRPGLLKDVEKAPGLKILDGKFTAVQQAVGTNGQYRRGGLSCGLRRGGEEVGPGGEADRAPQGQGSVGRATGLRPGAFRCGRPETPASLILSMTDFVTETTQPFGQRLGVLGTVAGASERVSGGDSASEGCLLFANPSPRL